MFLIPPTGRKLKWDIRFRNHDGRVRKVPGDRDRTSATRIGERVERLVNAKQIGDPPPGDLREWIDSMDAALANRLVELGLLPPRVIGRNKPLLDWVDQWVAVVQGRKRDSKGHAPQQGQKARRIIVATKAHALSALDPDEVTEKINAFKTLGCKNATPLSDNTRRHYTIAITDFATWLSRKLKIEDPLADLKVPPVSENYEVDRQPLTVAQFQQLTAHLRTFDRYSGQKSRWDAADRLLIYWTAVRTAYREGEMMKLRKFNLYLDETPPVVCLKARDTKNKAKGEVPIPHDLAVALKKYVADLEPEDRVFPFPLTSGSIVDMLRLDLDGAGIPWKLPGGEIVDFHAFRSTAISWWLDVDGLTPKRVQILARLKTLALVQNYSRNMRIDEYGWLDKGPKLVTPANRRRSDSGRHSGPHSKNSEGRTSPVTGGKLSTKQFATCHRGTWCGPTQLLRHGS